MRNLYLAFLALFITSASLAQEQTGTTVQTDITTMTTYGGTTGSTGSIVGVNGHNIEGKRLLLNHWVRGTVLTTNNASFGPNYLYNVDLLSNDLLIKPLDANTVLIVDKAQTKSFTLDAEGPQLYFEKQTSFEKKSESAYYQVIARGKKYTLFKENKVKLQKADPYDRSQYVRGTIYDEYIPEDYYYAVMPDQSVHSFKLNKKNLFKAFPAEQSKIEAYLGAHSDDKIDDAFLVGLMTSLNE